MCSCPMPARSVAHDCRRAVLSQRSRGGVVDRQAATFAGRVDARLSRPHRAAERHACTPMYGCWIRRPWQRALPRRRLSRAVIAARCTASRSGSRTSTIPPGCHDRGRLEDCCLGASPAEDATTTALLETGGRDHLGKLTTWEFAIGGTAFDTPFPPARNPWNIEHDPAGSSSGSGAAVAAGLCAAAMGSDTGGRSAGRRRGAASPG